MSNEKKTLLVLFITSYFQENSETILLSKREFNDIFKIMSVNSWKDVKCSTLKAIKSNILKLRWTYYLASIPFFDNEVKFLTGYEMFDVFSNDFRLIFRQSRLVTSTPCSRVSLQQQQRQPRFLARNLGGNFQADVNQLDSIISVYSTLKPAYGLANSRTVEEI